MIWTNPALSCTRGMGVFQRNQVTLNSDRDHELTATYWIACVHPGSLAELFRCQPGVTFGFL
jgi:hypothetical protein